MLWLSLPIRSRRFGFIKLRVVAGPAERLGKHHISCIEVSDSLFGLNFRLGTLPKFIRMVHFRKAMVRTFNPLGARVDRHFQSFVMRWHMLGKCVKGCFSLGKQASQPTIQGLLRHGNLASTMDESQLLEETC